MFRNKYNAMENPPGLSAGEAAGGMMRPQLYQTMHPFVMEACDGMDMYGDVMPDMCVLRCMCDRMCEKMFRVYPEMAKYDVETEVDVSPQQLEGLEEQFRRTFPGGGFPRDLEELQRRHPREFEEFRRRRPESFRRGRGNVFREFILFLIFLEFLRRRRR